MEWIQRWNQTPGDGQGTFRVKTKLNSEEAVRRLNRIHQGFILPTTRISKVCKEERGYETLEEGLSAADGQLLLCIRLLNEHCVGEREYLGTAVVTMEGILSKTTDMLLRIELARQTGQRFPHGFHPRMNVLVTQLNAGCRLLASMRHTVEEEVRRTHAGEEADAGGWTAWGPLLGSSKGSKAVASEEHHEREHLFTGLGWRQRQGCRCLDYR